MTRHTESISLLGLGNGLPTVDPTEHATFYVMIAGLFLLLALRLLARAVAPVGPLARAVSAAVMAALAVGAALALIMVAVFGEGLS
jgi:hypothetical protein